MEDNEDQPDDVRRATPVEEEIRKGEMDEYSERPVQNFETSRKERHHCNKNKGKKKLKEKREGECCRAKIAKAEKAPKTATVFVHPKECTLPKIHAIPRHCLTKEEWMTILATPSRKCPPACEKKPVTRRIRPVSPRMAELAQPPKQRLVNTLETRAGTLPIELIDKLIQNLEGETCLTPEQAEKMFREKENRSKKKCQKKKGKIKCPSEKYESIIDQTIASSGLSLDMDAVRCQYLMAENFVKNILDWKCPIPREEFKDIAEVIERRLSAILEYSPINGEDRKSQQMRFLADVIGSWISGVLFEVAEIRRNQLKEECERRKKEKEEESEDDSDDESGTDYSVKDGDDDDDDNDDENDKHPDVEQNNEEDDRNESKEDGKEERNTKEDDTDNGDNKKEKPPFVIPPGVLRRSDAEYSDEKMGKVQQDEKKTPEDRSNILETSPKELYGGQIPEAASIPANSYEEQEAITSTKEDPRRDEATGLNDADRESKSKLKDNKGEDKTIVPEILEHVLPADKDPISREEDPKSDRYVEPGKMEMAETLDSEKRRKENESEKPIPPPDKESDSKEQRDIEISEKLERQPEMREETLESRSGDKITSREKMKNGSNVIEDAKKVDEEHRKSKEDSRKIEIDGTAAIQSPDHALETEKLANSHEQQLEMKERTNITIPDETNESIVEKEYERLDDKEKRQFDKLSHPEDPAGLTDARLTEFDRVEVPAKVTTPGESSVLEKLEIGQNEITNMETVIPESKDIAEGPDKTSETAKITTIDEKVLSMSGTEGPEATSEPKTATTAEEETTTIQDGRQKIDDSSPEPEDVSKITEEKEKLPIADAEGKLETTLESSLDMEKGKKTSKGFGISALFGRSQDQYKPADKLEESKEKERSEKSKEKDEDSLSHKITKISSSKLILGKKYPTDTPFVTFDKIFHTIYNAIEDSDENNGSDAIANRIHRAVYEKLTNIVQEEKPGPLSEITKDVLEVMSGKIAIWLNKVLTESQVNFVNKFPATVESTEVREWARWVSFVTDIADEWSTWIQNTVRQAENMSSGRVTRGDWKDWVKNIDSDALQWRKFYLEFVHRAHQNVTMIRDRRVVKTGTRQFPEYHESKDENERELKITNLESDKQNEA